MNQIFFRVVNTQIALTIGLSLLAYVIYQDELMAKSAFFGGAVGFINGFIALRRSKIALDKLKHKLITDAKYSIYVGAGQRFFLTLILFILAFGYLKLHVLAVLAVFAITQLVFNWSLREFKKIQLEELNKF